MVNGALALKNEPLLSSQTLIREVKEKIEEYIEYQVKLLDEDGEMCLEMCQEINDYHMVTYWVPGIGEACMEFFVDEYKVYGEYLSNEIIKMYEKSVRSIKLLEVKVKKYFGSGSYNAYIGFEALCTMVLKAYQKNKIWCSVYGCIEDDYCDLKNAYHIIGALGDEENFPVKKLSDISAAMLDVNEYVQPSSMYDVFAYYADKYSTGYSVLDNYSFADKEKCEPLFTPDAFQYEAVISRWKRFNEEKSNIKKGIKSDHMLYFTKLTEVDKVLSLIKNDLTGYMRESYIMQLIFDEYLYKYSEPPKGLPLPKENFNIIWDYENDEKVFRITFKIRGICRQENEYREIYNKVHPIPKSAEEIMELLFNISEGIKINLSGMEKERGTCGKKAIEGKYPRKNLATHGLKLKEIPLYLAEHQSLYILKKTLRYAKNPVINCSFGRDSSVVLHLMRRVMRTGYKVAFNNSTNEYAETTAYKKELIDAWNLYDQYIETRPEMTYFEFKNTYGWNFEKKGDRRDDKQNLSELCCKILKHKPMENLIEKFGFDTGYLGLRAAESRSRDQSGKRDGLAYISTSWNQLRVNPILFFTDEMVSKYVEEYSVPISKIYDMVLYDENENIIYRPRTGCACCMLTAKYGYLKWLRNYKSKLYWHLMKKEGLAKTLYCMSLGIESNNQNGDNQSLQLSIFEESGSNNRLQSKDSFSVEDVNIDWDSLEILIKSRPCFFEKGLK